MMPNQSLRFSEEVRTRFPALILDFDEIEERMRVYEGDFRGRFTPRRREAGGIVPQDAARLIMFSALARARELVWSVVASINADLGAPMHLCARAHLEMAGMLVYFHKQIRKFLARETASARFQEQLDRLFLARRIPWPAGQHDEINTQAINVLTMIDSVDDMFEEADADELHGSYREAYEWLSERCHPNLSARAAYHETDRSDFVFRPVPTLDQANVSITLVHVRLGDSLVVMARRDITELVNGSWPDDAGRDWGD